MDSGQIPRISSTTDQLTQLTRPVPVTRGTGEDVQNNPGTSTGTARVSGAAANARVVEEQLFALEQHVPIQILQSPQLLKAEWAWKLLVFQQLAFHNAVSAHGAEPATQEGASEGGVGGHHGTAEPMANPGHVASVQERVPATEQGVLSGRSITTGVQRDPSEARSAPVSVHAEPMKSAEHASEQTVGWTKVVNMGPPEPGALAENDAEVAVRQLWGLLTAVSGATQRGGSQVQMNLRTDPPVLPFSAMNQDTIHLAHNKADESKVQQWVVHDRLVAGVLDNPYERVGSGLFFTPPNSEPADPPHQAVKWKAQRQTRLGAGGNLIHRLRLELEVHGRPLTCIVTAQRPQLLVHFVSDDSRLLHHLSKGEAVMSPPLKACGWELIGWTSGSDATNGTEESL